MRRDRIRPVTSAWGHVKEKPYAKVYPPTGLHPIRLRKVREAIRACHRLDYRGATSV